MPDPQGDLFRDLETQLTGESASGAYPVLDLSEISAPPTAIQVQTSTPAQHQPQATFNKSDLESLVRSMGSLNRRIAESLQMLSMMRKTLDSLQKDVDSIKKQLGYDNARNN